MAQELDNQIQRINFIIQGMNQQAWQDFISYELEKSGNAEAIVDKQTEETQFFYSEVLNHKYEFQSHNERREGLRTLSLEKMKKLWEKVVTGEVKRVFVAADKKNYF